MGRWIIALLAGLALALPAARAQEAPAGTYKVTLQISSRPILWILKLESKEGKLAGQVVDAAEQLNDSKLTRVDAADGVLRFTVTLKEQTFRFEGKLPRGGEKKLYGSMDMGNKTFPALLEPTALKSLDVFEVNQEVFAGPERDNKFFEAGLELIGLATEKKAKPEEVRAWADKLARSAEPFGPRWQRQMLSSVAVALSDQPGLVADAVAYARRAERMLDPDTDATTQMQVLRLLGSTLKKAGKADEAKELAARIDQLMPKVYQEYRKNSLPFVPVKYQGRKGKGDQVVLVELFTGAHCPPCVAADLAYDALEQTYPNHEVVLLQYHVHIPRPDPLANADTEARREYYDDFIQGAPTVLFNGRPEVQGGGGREEAQDVYVAYRQAIDPKLDKATGITLKATAARKGNALQLGAQYANLPEAGDQIRLRLALVEKVVNYTGSNKVPFHHNVVRALPGGAKGFALKEKSGSQTAAVDLGELKKQLNKYLQENEFSEDNRPLNLKDLRLIAFVQNDKTKQVLQAAEVEVKEE